jgi:iron complex outermembrane recepter protein
MNLRKSRKHRTAPGWWLPVVIFLGLTDLLATNPDVPQGEEKTTSSDGEVHPPEELPALRETIVVTASRSPEAIRDSVSYVGVVSERDLEEAASPVLDGVLRRVPGFNLFRRSSSLTSHPTTQGVSLRGIGPSGAGRSLVLVDGVPANDPFGGWVYWNRLPRAALERVEVARGAGSQLYGSSALGGTIQLVTIQPESRRFRFSGLLGSHETRDAEFLYGDRRGDWRFLASGRLFDTGGFHLMRPSDRGSVDVPVRYDMTSLFGRLSYRSFQAGLNLYSENRGNGTRLQTNASDLYQLDLGVSRDRVRTALYFQGGVLRSRFSRVLPGRSDEVLTGDQRFESHAVGASALFSPNDDTLLGTDWRVVRWDQRDQNLWGVFLQRKRTIHPRIDLQTGARLDLWENRRVQWSLNPKAGLLLRASDRVTIRGSVYRGFRAPTLNELYRPFRVGNVVTMANPELGAESLWGAEAGADFHPVHFALLRVNTFWNRLRDPVGNVTVAVAGGEILRRRMNIGSARVRGLEFDGILFVDRMWRLDLAYLLSDSEAAGSALRLPQVPLHQFSAGVRRSGRVTVSLHARGTAAQFDDDLNDFRLRGFVVADLFVGRTVSERLELFVSVENLFDNRYPTALTPEARLGEPRTVYGGIRVSIDR